MSKLVMFGCYVGVNGTEVAQNARSCSAKTAFVGGLFLTFISSVPALPNWDEKVADPHFVTVQGQDIELPEDFLVRVDGNKLRVALVSLGAIDSPMSTSSLLVSLLNSNGEEKVATTNKQGIAEFNDVNPDELHALLVVDNKAHAAIPLMTVSIQNATKRNITSSNFRLPLMSANPEEILASITRGILPTSNPDGELFSAGDYSLKAVNPFRVHLQKDGNLLGRIVVADRDLDVKLRFAKLTFLRNRQVVARTDSNPADGSFNVAGLVPGVYGVIAAGPAGYSSFAFDILPSASTARLGESISGKPVSLVQADPNGKLFVFLCPPKLVPKITDRIRQAYSQPNVASTTTQPVSGLTMAGNGGGFGGGGFGRGGGFGGGGFGGGGFSGRGFGGLAAIAGLATVAAIVSTNDNNNSGNNVVSPITPIKNPVNNLVVAPITTNNNTTNNSVNSSIKQSRP